MWYINNNNLRYKYIYYDKRKTKLKYLFNQLLTYNIQSPPLLFYTSYLLTLFIELNDNIISFLSFLFYSPFPLYSYTHL